MATTRSVAATRARPFSTHVGLSQLVTTAIVFLLPIRVLSPVAPSIVSVGALIALPILPFVAGRLRGYRFLPALVVTPLLVLAAAPVMWAASGERAIDRSIAVSFLLTLVVACVHLFYLLWARIHISVSVTAIAYGLGMLAQVLLTYDRVADNPWKYGLAFPVTLVALAFAAVFDKRPFISSIVLLAVIFVSISFGFRSFAAIGGVALVASLWLARSRPTTRPGLRVLGLAALAYVGYVVFAMLAVIGALGERNKIVSQEQIAQSGSLLAGGRIETAAAFAMFRARPIGLGPGVLPTSDDIDVGRYAIWREGTDIDGTYVQDYLFGATVKLHSVAADLWVNFGIAGLAWAILLAVGIVTGLSARVALGRVQALYLFLAILALWDLAFSPIGTNLWEVLLASALLWPREVPTSAGESSETPGRASERAEDTARRATSRLRVVRS